MLPQGTRRCPRLHLSRGRRLRCPALPPLALPAAPAAPAAPLRAAGGARGAGAPSGARDAARTGGSAAPPRRLRSLPCLRRRRFPKHHQCPPRQSPRCPRAALPPVALLPPVAVPVPPVEIVPPPPVDVVPPRPLAVVPPEPTVPAVAVEPPLPPPIESEPEHPTAAKSTADSQDRAVLPSGRTPRVVGCCGHAILLRTGLQFRTMVNVAAGHVPSLSSGRSGSRDVLGDECRVPNVGHQLCAGRVRVNPVARVLRIWKVARLRQRGPDVDHIDR